MMKSFSSIFCVAFILAIVSVPVYCDSQLWSLLPPAKDWQTLLDSFEHHEDINTYVEIYLAPFMELQAAMRNTQISANIIKNNLIIAIDLTLKCLTSFTISERHLLRHDRMQYRKALYLATKPILNDAMAQQLGPTFHPMVLRNFLFQRLNDMLVVSKKSSQLKEQLSAYHQVLNELHQKIDEMEPEKAHSLIQRNLDLDEIQRYSTGILQGAVGKKDVNVDTMESQLKSLANWAVSSNGSHLLIIVTIASFALLML